MYFKLAMKNVKKSFKDFLIYFLTLAFSVCLFYTFNSFQAQQAVLQMSETQAQIVDMLMSIMSVLSVFVALVLAFLILYANNFLIKRRKKEFGLYTLMGMGKHKIARILVYETFIIGITSLIVGMLAGILMSQVLTAVSANLFEVPLNYHFIFSPSATLLTVVSFGIIFIITMIFNSFILNRYKLISLLTADRKSEELKTKNIWVSVIIFVLSLILLGGDYYVALHLGVMAFLSLYIVPICIAGILGTFLFFLSLAGFLLSIIKHNKGIYFKNLNCFVLRQINANINSNFISMSIVCIMLLFSIGALSTGLSINQTINAQITNTSPYDFTYMGSMYRYSGKDPIPTAPANTKELLETLPIDKKDIKYKNIETIYLADIRLSDPVLANNAGAKYKQMMKANTSLNLQVIPLSVFNQERKVRNRKPITLAKDQTYVFSNVETISDPVHSILKNKPTLTLYGHTLHIVNKDYDPIAIGTTRSIGDNPMAFVINDSLIPKNAPVFNEYLNINHTKGISDANFENKMAKAIDAVNNKLPEGIFLQPTGSITTKDDVYQGSKGLSVVFTYIGIYLGIVFLIASAVILALQQLSQAGENKKRYMILSKIGAEKHMINHSIVLQIGIYFFLPLALAVVHSYVGIHVVNALVLTFGRSDILMPSIITGGIILCIYGLYFLITYIGYKNIIKGS